MSDAGPSLVFAHYFGGSARSWNPLLGALGAGNFRAPDLPGFGGTPIGAAPSLDAYADYVLGFAGVGPWIAVGHSMGGKIALAVAARRPPGLAGLILIAASPPTPEPMTEGDRQVALDAYGSRRIARKQLTETAGRLPPALLAICVEDELRVAEPAWTWWLERGSRDDISAATAGLDLPVLVVAGDDDTAMGPNTAPGIARHLRRSTLRIVADAGHLVPLERPEAVAELIRAFVSSLAPVAV